MRIAGDDEDEAKSVGLNENSLCGGERGMREEYGTVRVLGSENDGLIGREWKGGRRMTSDVTGGVNSTHHSNTNNPSYSRRSLPRRPTPQRP